MINGTITQIKQIFDEIEERDKVEITVVLYPMTLTAPHTNETRNDFRQRLQKQVPSWSMLNNIHLGKVGIDQEVNEVDINDIVSEYFG